QPREGPNIEEQATESAMDLGDNQVNGQQLGAADERQLVESSGENNWYQSSPSLAQGEAPMDGKEELQAGEHTASRIDQSKCLEKTPEENLPLEISVGAQSRSQEEEEFMDTLLHL
ncbi:hypothetical protein GOODEAATRI_021322, partial [Goodea atripinnis]